MSIIKKFISAIKARRIKKYDLDYDEDSICRDYSYVKTVPWNLNFLDFHREYENLRPLAESIRANVKIYNIDSRLQRLLCINEIRDVINADTHYKKFTVADLESLGEYYAGWAFHSDVYINKEKGIVYKSKDIFANDHDKKHNPMDTIYEYLLHNIIFPNTALHLEGTGTKEGKPTLVFSQPFVGEDFSAVNGEKMKYMSILGLSKSDYSNYGNEYFTLYRVHSTTTFSDNGNLYFIDPEILFNKSPLEVFRHTLGLDDPASHPADFEEYKESLIHEQQRWQKEKRIADEERHMIDFDSRNDYLQNIIKTIEQR